MMKAFYLTVVENNVLRVQVNAESKEEAIETFYERGLNSFNPEIVDPYYVVDRIQECKESLLK
mgnify:CR=1 FL=1